MTAELLVAMKKHKSEIIAALTKTNEPYHGPPRVVGHIESNLERVTFDTAPDGACWHDGAARDGHSDRVVKMASKQAGWTPATWYGYLVYRANNCGIDEYVADFKAAAALMVAGDSQ